MKIDAAFGRLRLEVGREVINLKSHLLTSCADASPRYEGVETANAARHALPIPGAVR
jgi:hypothetical protein